MACTDFQRTGVASPVSIIVNTIVPSVTTTCVTECKRTTAEFHKQVSLVVVIV